MPKLHIALLYGGWGNERFVSQNTARNLLHHFDADRYIVHPVDIRADGFYLAHPDDETGGIPIDRGTLALPFGGAPVRPDLAYIAIHGTPGEDGRLQGFLDVLGIRYTGCPPLISAITFHKQHGKLAAAHAGLKTAPSVVLTAAAGPDYAQVSARLGSSILVVKPCSSGSSFGASVVHSAGEWYAALAMALQDDAEIIVEPYLTGSEYTIAAYRGTDGQVKVLPVLQRQPHQELAFATKDNSVWKQEHLEPLTNPAMQQRLAAWACAAYEKLSLRGPVRFDIIHQSEEGEDAFYFLEVNTVPGMSAKSIFTGQLEMAGISMQDFLTVVVEEAMRSNLV